MFESGLRWFFNRDNIVPAIILSVVDYFLFTTQSGWQRWFWFGWSAYFMLQAAYNTQKRYGSP